jgi:hypothetical protein
MGDLFMNSDAVFSPCRTYRYRLSRIWDVRLPLAAFVMLNPSTADETANDPTSRRCINFARSWRYGGVMQVNLFALRGSDPAVLMKHTDSRRGPDNDLWLARTAQEADLVVAAWGAHPAAIWRGPKVLDFLADIGPVHIIRLTASGHPEHPLYLPSDLKPIWYRAGRAA